MTTRYDLVDFFTALAGAFVLGFIAGELQAVERSFHCRRRVS